MVHCRQLGQIANFTGNEKDYYDPDNSCINMVLQRRTGIPITLGLLYMAVAQRMGLSLHGLNLPGHLMVGNSIEGVTNLLVDPFDGNACRFCSCLHPCKHFWSFALESLTQALQNMGFACARSCKAPSSSRSNDRHIYCPSLLVKTKPNIIVITCIPISTACRQLGIISRSASV